MGLGLGLELGSGLVLSRFQSLMYPKKIRKASMNESGTLSTRGTRHSSHRWAPMRDITKAHWPNAPFTDSRTKLGRSWEDRPASPEGGAGLTPIEAIGFHWTGVLMAVLLPLLVSCSSYPWQTPAPVSALDSPSQQLGLRLAKQSVTKKQRHHGVITPVHSITLRGARSRSLP